MATLKSLVKDLDYGIDDVFLNDVIDGFSKPQKTLPCKYFYDEKGSLLFEDICDTPEYYVTRTECQIYQNYAKEMSAAIGEQALVVEPGAGSVKKIALLLEHLSRPVGFVPMDISAEILERSTKELTELFPTIDIMPMVTDFLDTVALEAFFMRLPAKPLVNKRVIFFPGSTIGNFHPDDAKCFLKRFADHLRPGDGLLIGVDLVKNHQILESAYNDQGGVTADFNLNIIERIANDLQGDINADDFSHRAVFNPIHNRIEMHLVSERPHTVTIANECFSFAKDETIHTENSYKYAIEHFHAVANKAGFTERQWWTDENDLFSVHYLEVAG